MKKKWRSMCLVIALIVSSTSVLANTEPAQDAITQIDNQGGTKNVTQPVDNVIPTDPTITEPTTIEENVPEETNKEETTPEVDGQKQVVLKLNSKVAVVDAEEVMLNTPPTVVEGKTFLPLRFVADKIVGASVEWNPQTKQVTVTKEGQTVTLTVGSNVALVNGIETPVDAPPIIMEGSTLLPVRFISEQFQITTTYDATTKEIRLVGNTEVVQANPPIAQFRFEQESYVAGQNVVAVNESYDPEGLAIVATEWQLDGDSKKVNADLSKMFSKPKAGTYQIGLRVKNEKGAWSEWSTQFITIQPNMPPTVTEIKTNKSSFARGEMMEFSYTYENEEWEKIKTEKWTYRPVSSLQTTIIPTKPEAIFDEGEYIITLQLQDEYGNWGEKKELQVTVTDELIKTEFEHKFKNAKIGDTIDNFSSFNYQNYKEIFANDIMNGIAGTLIMSNSPEMVSQKGILYQEQMQDIGRVLIHHINDFEEQEALLHNKRLVVVATNEGKETATLAINNKTMKGPIEDVLHLGQQVLYHYFKGTPQETYTLNPNQSIVVFDNGTKKWGKGQSYSGMFDYYTATPVKLTVAVIDQEDTIANIPNMNKPPRDVHPRGTFPVMNQYYTVDLTNEEEPVKLVIGKGAEEWLKGKDALTGEEVYNRGNFGMEYHIKVTAKENTAMIINPRGNSYKGAIKWMDEGAYLTPTIGYFTGGRDRAAFGGVIPAGTTREFVYVLPNGSAAPVLFGFIPESKWH